MNHQQLGAQLLKIAAFLYACRYLTAAIILGPNQAGFDKQTFEFAYQSVGVGLTSFAFVAAVAGVAFFSAPYIPYIKLLHTKAEGGTRTKQ